MDPNWTTISVSENTCDISSENFWNGIKVWIERPHIINPRIFGVHVIENLQLVERDDGLVETSTDKILKVIQSMPLFTSADLQDCLKDSFHIETCKTFLEELGEKEDSRRTVKKYIVQLRCLLPKQMKKFESSLEILLIDESKDSVTFVNNSSVKFSPGISPSFPYRLMCNSGRVQLDALINSEHDNASQKSSLLWLQNSVLTKVTHWSCCIPKSPTMSSLRQVPMNNYNENYHLLKSKYGEKLVKIWPECTNPLKFVYEDIGIAAYLLTLWEKERMVLNLTEKQSFIDLGCGNGVLVYILASEGHKGVGVDVRKRTIWDLYGPETRLIEQAYTPSEDMLFPEYDWIIGNHSDELTPWIPVIAARSSSQMRAFLLPCCCYTFNGKYQRSHGSISNYQSYMEFLKILCTRMGFNVTMDKLRIPSTKRICLTCMSRNYQPEEEAEVDKQRIMFIQQHSSKQRIQSPSIISSFTNKSSSTGEKHSENFTNFELGEKSPNMIKETWVSNFKPRDKKELVHNCTALDRTFLNAMVLQIFKILIELSDDSVALVIDGKEVNWRIGGKLSLGELVQKLNDNDLLQLKNQNGGLQTLLRNHKNIFNVINGIVCISTHTESSHQPSAKRRRGKRSKIKNSRILYEQNYCKPCFFYCHHPQGCPLPSGTCLYAHSTP